MAQMGFFDVENRYAALDAKNNPLVKINAAVPWEPRSRLERGLAQAMGGSPLGQPSSFSHRHASELPLSPSMTIHKAFFEVPLKYPHSQLPNIVVQPILFYPASKGELCQQSPCKTRPDYHHRGLLLLN